MVAGLSVFLWMATTYFAWLGFVRGLPNPDTVPIQAE
jgi:hypothetical protein